jgi:hypothetical protein
MASISHDTTTHPDVIASGSAIEISPHLGSGDCPAFEALEFLHGSASPPVSLR